MLSGVDDVPEDAVVDAVVDPAVVLAVLFFLPQEASEKTQKARHRIRAIAIENLFIQFFPPLFAGRNRPPLSQL